MELITDTACLLCKQQTTVLKLDNVKSYLDKLFDTFFDKSNIFKDEFQGMVENASLCLICTSKVNICCNLRIDYEDKYNSKCLQKILSYSNCLLCDSSNSTSLTKTQDMPSNLLQQIELFMNSTSFPESYSNSVLCLTCILFLNIWYEVRSSVMKLKQNDENYGASNNCKKTKITKNNTTDKSNEEDLTVIDLVDSDSQDVENPMRSATHSSIIKAGSILDDVANDLQNKISLSNSLRSESPSLILSQKFQIQQKSKQLFQNKYVIDKESLISDSSNSEIDSLSKMLDEIAESYGSECNSLSLGSTKAQNFHDELSITTIDDSSDNENESNTASQLLPKTFNSSMSFSSDSEKSSQYFSTTSSNLITTKVKFPSIMEDSSGSGIINEKNLQKLNPKVSLQSERRKHKRYNNEDQGKTITIIDNSSDEESFQKNTRKVKHRRLSSFPNGSSELKVLKNTNSVNDKQEITNFEGDEVMTERNKQMPISTPSPISKSQEENKFNELELTTESEFFSDTESTQKEQSSDLESKIDNSSESERNSGYLNLKTSFEIEPFTNEISIDQIMQVDDSSDSKNVPDKEITHLKAASFETNTKNTSFETNPKNTDENQGNASKISEELIMKSNLKQCSHRNLPTDQQIGFPDSSDKETVNTVSSKSRKGEDTEIRKKNDLNKKLEKLQSVEKLHKMEKINLPKNGLDDKFYKQLPYVLLNNDEITDNIPKINSTTTAVSDEESRDIVNTSLGEFNTWCCRICDKTSNTLCEHKAHELFHIKPQHVIINVVRDNLKQIQEQYNGQATANINKILAKYLDINELQEILPNGQASGNGYVEAKHGKLCSPRVKRKSSLTSKNNSACRSTPNVVIEKKQRLSILVNKKNSKDKSDNCLRTPKKVRFSLDD